MPDPTELQLRFRAPQDVKLPEVAVLTKSISNLYEAIERISANRQDSSAESRDANKLGRRLVIKELRYASDLILVLLAASSVALQIPSFIVAARQLRDSETQRVNRERLENKEATERSFRKLMRERDGEKLREAVSVMADELGIDTEKLLEIVGPELETIYQSKIAFSLGDLPYK